MLCSHGVGIRAGEAAGRVKGGLGVSRLYWKELNGDGAGVSAIPKGKFVFFEMRPFKKGGRRPTASNGSGLLHGSWKVWIYLRE